MVIVAKDEDYKNKKAVVEEYPSAVKIIRAGKKPDGCWIVFEYWTDYEIWKLQK